MTTNQLKALTDLVKELRCMAKSYDAKMARTSPGSRPLVKDIAETCTGQADAVEEIQAQLHAATAACAEMRDFIKELARGRTHFGVPEITISQQACRVLNSSPLSNGWKSSEEVAEIEKERDSQSKTIEQYHLGASERAQAVVDLKAQLSKLEEQLSEIAKERDAWQGEAEMRAKIGDMDGRNYPEFPDGCSPIQYQQLKQDLTESRAAEKQAREECKSYADAILTQLSGIICTPETGYVNDGGSRLANADLERMRKLVEVQHRILELAETKIASLQSDIQRKDAALKIGEGWMKHVIEDTEWTNEEAQNLAKVELTQVRAALSPATGDKAQEGGKESNE